jgi:hypothetical protein
MSTFLTSISLEQFQLPLLSASAPLFIFLLTFLTLAFLFTLVVFVTSILQLQSLVLKQLSLGSSLPSLPRQPPHSLHSYLRKVRRRQCSYVHYSPRVHSFIGLKSQSLPLANSKPRARDQATQCSEPAISNTIPRTHDQDTQSGETNSAKPRRPDSLSLSTLAPDSRSLSTSAPDPLLSASVPSLSLSVSTQDPFLSASAPKPHSPSSVLAQVSVPMPASPPEYPLLPTAKPPTARLSNKP